MGLDNYMYLTRKGTEDKDETMEILEELYDREGYITTAYPYDNDISELLYFRKYWRLRNEIVNGIFGGENKEGLYIFDQEKLEQLQRILVEQITYPTSEGVWEAAQATYRKAEALAMVSLLLEDIRNEINEFVEQINNIKKDISNSMKKLKKEVTND